MALRIRQDAVKLPTWDPILEWYAKGVRELQSRPITDPTSWRYQAAIHDYIAGEDPLAQPGEQLPPQAERRRFWARCQHFCWFFLPWHRIYLLYFERMVADAIKRLGGPDWALPYWNYSGTQPGARSIPAAFREERMPDGSDNPLFVRDRDFGNDGSPVGTTADVDVCTALEKGRFAAQALGGDPGFGGGRSGFNHRSAPGMIPGELERVPHGSMHSEVGGFMGMFHTAGLDPLFWMHHANIDRLWEAWRRIRTTNTNPPDALWRTGVTFEFHDETGAIVQHTSADVEKTTSTLLGYEYDDVSNPCGGEVESIATEDEPMSDRKPEMVGATDRPIALTGQPAVAHMALSPPTGPAGGLEATSTQSTVYLNVENITGSGKPLSYAVYLNVPAGEEPDQHPELFAGILPMFGVAESSRSDDAHAGGGVQYTLDVTRVVRVLEQRGDWNSADVRISFVPRRRAMLESAAGEPPIQVGRVSIYVA